jgi:hypothetical protein
VPPGRRYAAGRMDLRRLRVGEWLAAVSGAALLVSLFLPWYGAGGGSSTAWEALAVLDILIALVAASAVVLLVVTATQRVPAVPIALSACVTFAGAIGVGLVLIRVASLPDGADGREWALWLGLAGAVGIVVGGAVAIRDERISPPGRPTDLTGRPTAAQPEIEPLPTPRPE